MGLSAERTILFVCLVTLLSPTPVRSSSQTSTLSNVTSSVNTVSTQSKTWSASQTYRPTEDLPSTPDGEEERVATECLCPDLNTTFACNCTAQSGFMVSPNLTGQGVLIYNIEAEDLAVLSIHFTKKDVPSLSSVCTLIFGEEQYSATSELNSVNVVHMDPATPIRVSGYFPYCKFKLYYNVFDLTPTVEYINETEGFLVPPEDPTGTFNYLPNTLYLWIFTPNVLVSKFNFTFNLLDLGAPSNVIHGSNKVNQSEGDFLLIGPGEDVLGGSEIMFYGRREANKIRQVVTLGEKSHVCFRSFGNSFNATGFNISFAAEVVEVTTTEPSTTANPIPPENLETYTVTAINGARKGKPNINDTIDSFEVMIAAMANDYLLLNDQNNSVTITSEMVEVEDARGCRYHCELDTCVSFNFSVAAQYPNGSWIFTKSRLDDMLKTEVLMDNLEILGPECKICGDPERNMWMYVSIPVAIVVIACIVSMAFWFFGARDHQDDARLKYEQEIADRMDDNRRRSSADVSILGVGGGSIASRGTLNSRRFTMPFPKAKRTEDGEDDGDAVDMSGYKEYDPDIGRIDPINFGIHKELLSDKTAVKHYTNLTFVDDDEDESTVFRRERDQQQDTVAAGTDSEDSDGGAVSFGSRRKKNTSATPVTATVEVHRPDHLSLQRLSGNSETAL